MEKQLQRYKALKELLSPMLDELKQLENEIKSHVLETGELVSIDGVTTSIRKGYTRSSWDTKGLKGYAKAYPDVLDFLKESKVNDSVVIKVEL